MPQLTNFKDEYIITPDTESFSLVTGREIYERPSFSGLNRSPIIKLQSFILAGLTESSEPGWEVKDISERLLVDGTIVWYQPEGFLRDVYEVSETRILVKARDDEGRIVTGKRRRFERSDADKQWELYDDDDGGIGGMWRITRSYGAIPDDALFVYINGLGLLYHVQFIYHRLEEIQSKLRWESTSAKTKTFISGFTGDQSKMDAAVQDKSNSVISIPSQVSVDSPYNGALVDKLLAEKADLRISYDEGVMDFITNEAVTMSGVSRRLLMGPMLQFVKGQRAKLIEIFNDRFRITLEFDKVQILTSDERTAEYNLLKQKRDDSVITPAEFAELAREL